MTSIAKPREFHRLNTVVDLAGSESKNPWKHRAPFSRFGRKRLPIHGVEGGFNCRIEGQKFRRTPYTVRIALIALRTDVFGMMDIRKRIRISSKKGGVAEFVVSCFENL